MKTLGNALLSLFIFLGLIFLIFLFFKGAQFFAAILAPLVIVAPTIIGIGIIFVLLSLVPPLKRALLFPILITSYIVGFLLFVESAFLTLDVFNILWLIVGILLCGFGITPIAMIACIFSQQWGILANLVFMLAAVVFFRWYVYHEAMKLSMGGGPKEAQAKVE
ncbi:hypothetical protein IKW72_00865 [bacterium]|nr:hypothetical protein [bacterium]